MVGGGAVLLPAYPQARGLRKRLQIDTTKETQFSDAWIVLAFLLLGAGLLFAQGSLIVIAGLLLLISAIGWLWDRVALVGIEYKRTFAERRAFASKCLQAGIGPGIVLDQVVIR